MLHINQHFFEMKLFLRVKNSLYLFILKRSLLDIIKKRTNIPRSAKFVSFLMSDNHENREILLCNQFSSQNFAMSDFIYNFPKMLKFKERNRSYIKIYLLMNLEFNLGCMFLSPQTPIHSVQSYFQHSELSL